MGQFVKKFTDSNMSSISRQTLKLASAHLRPAFRRNLATSYFLAQAAPTDPVQGLFLDKIRDYATKKAAAGGKLVDATPETEAALQAELDGGGQGVDMTKFPDMTWSDAELQSLELGSK